MPEARISVFYPTSSVRLFNKCKVRVGNILWESERKGVFGCIARLVMETLSIANSHKMLVQGEDELLSCFPGSISPYIGTQKRELIGYDDHFDEIQY